MKILITGGAGYIGTELAHALAAHSKASELIIYDNLSRKNYNLFLANRLPASTPIRFIQGDLLDSHKLRAVLREVEVVFHLAAKVSTPFANEDPHSFEQVNHWGTAELSYALEESAVKRVFYLSSTSVYGASEELVTEATVPNPHTYYGISKLKGEAMLQRLAGQRQVHILRCGNVYGYSPSMRFDAVINKFMFEGHFNNRITIHGSGKQHRAFIHIKNVIKALMALLETDSLEAGAYNLVQQNLSVLELSSMLKAIYPELEMLFIQQNIRLRNLEVEPDNYLSKQGFIEKRNLEADLREFQEHFAFAPARAEQVK